MSTPLQLAINIIQKQARTALVSSAAAKELQAKADLSVISVQLNQAVTLLRPLLANPTSDTITDLLARLKVLMAGTGTTVDTSAETVFLRVDGSAVVGDSFSDYRVQRWLQDLKDTRLWAGLLGEGAGAVDDLSSIEVGGSTYRRPELSWRWANPRLLVSDTPTSWLGIPKNTTAYAVALFDAPYNGNVEAVMPLPRPRDFLLGGSYTLPAGELFLGLR